MQVTKCYRISKWGFLIIIVVVIHVKIVYVIAGTLMLLPFVLVIINFTTVSQACMYVVVYDCCQIDETTSTPAEHRINRTGQLNTLLQEPSKDPTPGI